MLSRVHARGVALAVTSTALVHTTRQRRAAFTSPKHPHLTLLFPEERHLNFGAWKRMDHRPLCTYEGVPAALRYLSPNFKCFGQLTSDIFSFFHLIREKFHTTWAPLCHCFKSFMTSSSHLSIAFHQRRSFTMAAPHLQRSPWSILTETFGHTPAHDCH